MLTKVGERIKVRGRLRLSMRMQNQNQHAKLHIIYKNLVKAKAKVGVREADTTNNNNMWGSLFRRRKGNEAKVKAKTEGKAKGNTTHKYVHTIYYFPLLLNYTEKTCILFYVLYYVMEDGPHFSCFLLPRT